MALKYGDAVVLVKKSPDGLSETRVNAIVMASSAHAPTTHDRKVIKVDGKPLPPEEHLDVAFARPMPDGHALKSHDLGQVFQPAYDVRHWQEDVALGWELPGRSTFTAPKPPNEKADKADKADEADKADKADEGDE